MASMRRVTGKAAKHVDGREHQGRKRSHKDGARQAVRFTPASAAQSAPAPMAMMLEMALVTRSSAACAAQA